jgi:hypothetical protein
MSSHRRFAEYPSRLFNNDQQSSLTGATKFADALALAG